MYNPFINLSEESINKTPKKKTPADYFKTAAVLIFLFTIVGFAFTGWFNIIKSFFTPYTIQVLDVVYFTSGLTLLGITVILTTLADLKTINESIAKGTIQILRNHRKPEPLMPTNFNMFSGLFGANQNNPDITGVSGSISLIDPLNPDQPPMFQGSFDNINEMEELKKRLMKQMLGSTEEFHGKKITKQEKLESLTLNELELERLKAEKEEDWMWAAAVRDQIAKKKNS